MNVKITFNEEILMSYIQNAIYNYKEFRILWETDEESSPILDKQYLETMLMDIDQHE